jgi:hypothetical protein
MRTIIRIIGAYGTPGSVGFVRTSEYFATGCDQHLGSQTAPNLFYERSRLLMECGAGCFRPGVNSWRGAVAVD